MQSCITIIEGNEIYNTFNLKSGDIYPDKCRVAVFIIKINLKLK